MNQDRWKELVEQEAANTMWQFFAGTLATLLGVVTVFSVMTGYGHKWEWGAATVLLTLIWVSEKWSHKKTVGMLEEMARDAAGRGGIEA